MDIITPHFLASKAAARWAKMYPDSRLETRARLESLGPNPSPADVNQVIGNESWTSPPTCDECGDERPVAVVRLGEEPDYESSTAWVCRACVAKAMQLFPEG